MPQSENWISICLDRRDENIKSSSRARARALARVYINAALPGTLGRFL